MENERYLEMWRLTKSYPTPAGGTVTIVKGFSLCVAEGEFICLLGHSGCGKSTVLSMVAGLSSITSGAVVVDNREVDGPGIDRGIVFQAPCLLPWMTALENVALAVGQARPRLSRAERRRLAADCLAMLGLGDSLHKRPRELSGGMCQRVGIARAFALNPKVLLLDEPFGRLDCIMRMELQEVLLELWAENKKTAFMVTHDIDEALFLADRIVLMTNGPQAEVGMILDVPFERPRRREAIMDDFRYYDLRERMIGFLEGQDHRGAAVKVEPASETQAEEMPFAMAE